MLKLGLAANHKPNISGSDHGIGAASGWCRSPSRSRTRARPAAHREAPSLAARHPRVGRARRCHLAREGPGESARGPGRDRVVPGRDGRARALPRRGRGAIRWGPGDRLRALRSLRDLVLIERRARPVAEALHDGSAGAWLRGRQGRGGRALLVQPAPAPPWRAGRHIRGASSEKPPMARPAAEREAERLVRVSHALTGVREDAGPSRREWARQGG